VKRETAEFEEGQGCVVEVAGGFVDGDVYRWQCGEGGFPCREHFYSTIDQLGCTKGMGYGTER
jgi:hypothetical protein